MSQLFSDVPDCLQGQPEIAAISAITANQLVQEALYWISNRGQPPQRLKSIVENLGLLILAHNNVMI